MVFTVPESEVRFVFVVERLVLAVERFPESEVRLLFVVAILPERVATDPVIVERVPESAFCCLSIVEIRSFCNDTRCIVTYLPSNRTSTTEYCIYWYRYCSRSYPCWYSS